MAISVLASIIPLKVRSRLNGHGTGGLPEDVLRHGSAFQDHPGSVSLGETRNSDG